MMLGAPTLSIPILGWPVDFVWPEEEEGEAEHIAASECRLIAVDAENRMIAVDAENRMITVDAENRMITVGC